MGRKRTHEEFLNKFYEKNKNAQDIEILGTYVNSKTAIKCKCKIDGHTWEATPSNLLRGTGCPECAGLVKPTTEEFIIKLHKVNSNIIVLGDYINAQTKIRCRCKKCGHEWEALPYNLLRGNGCPDCAKKGRIKTQTEFINELYQKNPNIEVLGDYEKSKINIKCKCKVCGYIWQAKPNNLLNGCGCSKCAGVAPSTHKEFIIKLKQINSNIEVLGTYKNCKTKIKCKCTVCGHIWKATPNSLLNGHACPKCNITKGEKRIAQYLDNLNIHYIYNKQYFSDLYSIGGGLMRPDFIIPSLKIWIEYDGEQHFKPVDFTGAMSAEEVQQLFNYTQQNDQIKDQYAKDNNWILVRIPFTEYDNIEQILAAYLKQEQVI